MQNGSKMRGAGTAAPDYLLPRMLEDSKRWTEDRVADAVRTMVGRHPTISESTLRSVVRSVLLDLDQAADMERLLEEATRLVKLAGLGGGRGPRPS
jgi:hypothetical protein